MYTLNVYIDNGKMNARSLEMARLMRGMVPEWDNSYIEEQLPNDLLVKMMNTDKWTDDDGFHWGFGRLYATKLRSTNENVIVLANKPHGQGVHELKILMPDKSIQQIWDGNVL